MHRSLVHKLSTIIIFCAKIMIMNQLDFTCIHTTFKLTVIVEQGHSQSGSISSSTVPNTADCSLTLRGREREMRGRGEGDEREMRGR